MLRTVIYITYNQVKQSWSDCVQVPDTECLRTGSSPLQMSMGETINITVLYSKEAYCACTTLDGIGSVYTLTTKCTCNNRSCVGLNREVPLYKLWLE